MRKHAVALLLSHHPLIRRSSIGHSSRTDQHKAFPLGLLWPNSVCRYCFVRERVVFRPVSVSLCVSAATAVKSSTFQSAGAIFEAAVDKRSETHRRERLKNVRDGQQGERPTTSPPARLRLTGRLQRSRWRHQWRRTERHRQQQQQQQWIVQNGRYQQHQCGCSSGSRCRNGRLLFRTLLARHVVPDVGRRRVHEALHDQFTGRTL